MAKPKTTETEATVPERNPREVRLLSCPWLLSMPPRMYVSNGHDEVKLDHVEGTFRISPSEARRMADILRWQADMAEQVETGDELDAIADRVIARMAQRDRMVGR